MREIDFRKLALYRRFLSKIGSSRREPFSVSNSKWVFIKSVLLREELSANSYSFEADIYFFFTVDEN